MLDRYREAMAALPAAVVVVAARTDAGFRALTATSFTSASLDPPLALVCLDRFAQTRDAIVAGGRFTASVLERGQEFVAERFAGRAPLVDPSWRDVPHDVTEDGLPVVRGCVAWFACDVRSVWEAGDHDVVVGEVTAVERRRGEPLLLWDRSFWRLA